MQTANVLIDIYQRMVDHFGPQHWWPGDSPFEIMLGAVLTQNTNWQNVEKAIANLKEAGCLSYEAMAGMPREEIAALIRPAGYYNVKADRLCNLFAMITNNWDGDLSYFLDQPRGVVREELLNVKGVGPETADAMVLYAAGYPIFVVDAYTHRILSRHEIIPVDYGYFEIQELLMDNLTEDVELYNEYHALLVQTGKQFCKKTKPQCEKCPLAGVRGIEQWSAENSLDW